MPEHDLTLRLVSGEHSSEDAVRFFRSLDGSCATRWLSYFDPTVSMSRVDVASMPAMKHAITEKQQELFGDTPKPYAVVIESESAAASFRFWQRYFSESGNMRCFRRFEEAFDWLDLSPAARAAVADAIHDWEMARAVDAWAVADGASEPAGEAETSGGPDHRAAVAGVGHAPLQAAAPA